MHTDYTHLDRTDLQLARTKLRAQSKDPNYRSIVAKSYWDNPVGFVHDCFRWSDGKQPAQYQDEILAAIPKYGRVAAYGPHGLGKTAMEAWVILWFALTRDGEDWKLPSTASAWRQLVNYLWPEIRKWARLLRWEKIGRTPFDERTELLQLSLKLRTGAAFALATDDSELIEGAHADYMLYSFDESKAIPPSVWDSAEGAFSTGDCKAFAASTPGAQSGRFFQICAKKPGYEDWYVRHVTLDEAVTAGRISRDWAEQRKRQWGEQSAVYKNRVLGEFADGDDDSLIPLSWVERANERWHEVMARLQTDEEFSIGPLVAIGADISSGGVDRNVLALRHGDVIPELRATSREDVMMTTGRIKAILDTTDRRAIAIVDTIGVGAGVVARLREQGCKVYSFNAAEKTAMRDRAGELGFINKRAAAWWRMRELLDPEQGRPIALPPEDLLTGDLTAPHWEVTSTGKIQIESKDDIRETLERSTDYGDAVVQAFWLDSPAGAVGVASRDSRWRMAAPPGDEVEGDGADGEPVLASFSERWSGDGITTGSRWRR